MHRHALGQRRAWRQRDGVEHVGILRRMRLANSHLQQRLAVGQLRLHVLQQRVLRELRPAVGRQHWTWRLRYCLEHVGVLWELRIAVPLLQ
jgi:hypothetical protein